MIIFTLREKMIDNKKAVILQPGKLGDLIIITPIAKYYNSLGYDIYWPVFDNFISFVSRFGFIKPISFNISLDENLYFSKKRIDFWEAGKKSLEQITPSNKTVFDGVRFFDIFYDKFKEDNNKIIDPCFSFPGHRNVKNNEMTVSYANNNKNWINLKYDLVNVPLKERWNFDFIRNEQKEQELLEFIRNYSKKKYGSDKYSIIHSYNSSKLPNFDVINPINFSYVKNYDILDWLLVLENSENIVCVDSSLANFVEVCPSLREKNKLYLGSEEPHFHKYMGNILLNNWTNLSSYDITYGGFQI